MDTCANARKLDWVGEDTTDCCVYYNLLMVSI